MIKHYKKTFLGIMFSILTMPVFAQYDAGDLAALNQIITNNFSGTTALNWATEPDPGLWDNVTWDGSSPARVIILDFHNSTCSNGPGNVTDLTGDLDLTAFSELTQVYIKRNPNITSIDISGLTNLTLFTTANLNNNVSVDASNCPSLDYFKAKSHSSLTSINVTGSTSITSMRVPQNSSLTTITGFPALTNLLTLTIRNANIGANIDLSNKPQLVTFGAINCGISTLNLTGLTNLQRLKIRENSITDIDVSDLSSLQSFEINDNNLTSIDVSNLTNLDYITAKDNPNLNSLNVTGCTLLRKIAVRTCSLSDITGIMSLSNLQNVGLQSNKFPLAIAAPIHNKPGLSGNYNGLRFLDQDVYDDTTINISTSVDYSNQATIDINGTPVTSNFDLYDSGNNLISSNITGIFTPPSVGDYYVEMSNSGVTITTGNIKVLDFSTVAVINLSMTSNFGTVNVGSTSSQTLTISNSGGVALNISNIAMPTGFSYTGSVTSVAAGGSATINVIFTPTSAMTYNGTISITSDASAGNGDLSVTGMGQVVSGKMEKQESLLTFFPNPTSGKLYIQKNVVSVNDLNIYSSEGILVQKVDLSVSQYIDVQNLPKGVYIVKSLDGTITERFVKL